MYTVCLYGAASDRVGDRMIESVEELGRRIGLEGYSMIYGAGASGLMGAAARGIVAVGGTLIGVTPHFMHTTEPLFYDCTQMINTETMAERKEIMENNADAFVVVPGGIGTFDEFFQILTLKELGQQGNKPIILFSVDGYYDELCAMMRAADEKGFLRPTVMSLFSVCRTVDDVMKTLKEQLDAVSEESGSEKK